MQAIGICRFSYPAIGGFQVHHADTAAREAYLYDPARMEERFALFETLTLAPLRAQTDDDFTLLVIVGESLPASYRARLDALLADVPQATVTALPPLPHRKAMQAAINAQRRYPNQHCLQFRMDDDDAVAINFVARLRETATDLRKLARRHGSVGVDFCRGFVLRADSHGLHALPSSAPLMTAGLGLMVKPGNPASIMNFGHHNFEEAMPVVRFADEDMFIRSHNSHNDSRQKATAKPVKLLPVDPQAEQHLKARFNIDASAVRAAFSRLEQLPLPVERE